MDRDRDRNLADDKIHCLLREDAKCKSVCELIIDVGERIFLSSSSDALAPPAAAVSKESVKTMADAD